MTSLEVAETLLRGTRDLDTILPHLAGLRDQPFVFRVDFGLQTLPDQPGVILVRGPRQYGKSTWLEAQIKCSIEEHGPGSALYLNADEVPDATGLAQALRMLAGLFPPGAPVQRLFVDEITAVRDWERALKVVLDSGRLRRVLVVTTGSKATDLRRGGERFPGRKGRLDRTTYLFTPISFAEFERVCGDRLGDRTLAAYLLSGGAPVACGEMARRGRLPEYVPEMIRDWISGECAASGRQRSALVAVVEQLLRHGGSPLGQAKLAREAGLANNTVAAGFVELLADLMCVGVAWEWDASRRVRLRRKPAKFPFINLLAAVAWHPARPRSIDDLEALPPASRGAFLEWLAAQEVWRRAAIRGDEFPEQLAWWQSQDHEIDFVLDDGDFLEVKAGQATPLEFAWFSHRFPRGRLTVLTTTPFETERVRGLTMEQFLRGA